MSADVIAGRAAVELLADLIYELLDAHDDIARLVIEAGLDDDPLWACELEYVRALQRVAREGMALATAVVEQP